MRSALMLASLGFTVLFFASEV